MSRLFYKSICGMLLGFVLCLSGGRMSGKDVSAQGVLHRKLPRYYLRAYSIVDDKGKSSTAERVAVLTFIAALRSSVSAERILNEDPGDCNAENPCDEINLREEEQGSDRLKLTTYLVPKPASTLLHQPFET